MKITGSESIQGDGLRLRPIAEEDAGLVAAASVGDVPDWTFVPRNLDEGAAREWIRRGVGARDKGRAVRLVIEVEGKAAGTVGAQHPHDHDLGILETFYFVLPEFRRRGLATAGLKLFNAWAEEVTPELRRLQLHVIVGHPGSGRVAELAGYKYEGVAVNQIPAVNGFGPRDAKVYAIAVVSRGEAKVGGVLA